MTILPLHPADNASPEALRAFLAAPLDVAGSGETVTTLADGTPAVLS